jgi:hypothetical protein
MHTTSANGHTSARAAFCFGYDSADTQRLTILRAFPQELRSLQPRIVRAQSAHLVCCRNSQRT